MTIPVEICISQSGLSLVLAKMANGSKGPAN
jgi:hypothetical protein